MTSIDELKRIAGRKRVGLGIVEKDHAITVALMVLSKTKLSEMLVFKGGTAIKKMYYPEARFSEDLDFECRRDLARELARAIRMPLIENHEGVTFTGVRMEETRAEGARRLSLRYDDWSGYPNSIKLDLSFREEPVLRTRKIEVKNFYGIKNAILRAMDITEIMAEKVRALIHARKARHLYDIWFLTQKQVGTTADLLNEKLTIYNEKFDEDILKSSIEEVKHDWETDLQALISEVPTFPRVQSDVLDTFSKLKSGKQLSRAVS
jgi:predicted nucleotidyltransferase component of viral defense system